MPRGRGSGRGFVLESAGERVNFYFCFARHFAPESGQTARISRLVEFVT
jgi:hypothetical protein